MAPALGITRRSTLKVGATIAAGQQLSTVSSASCDIAHVRILTLECECRSAGNHWMRVSEGMILSTMLLSELPTSQQPHEPRYTGHQKEVNQTHLNPAAVDEAIK